MVERRARALVELAPTNTAAKNRIAQVRGAIQSGSLGRVTMRTGHGAGKTIQNTKLLAPVYDVPPVLTLSTWTGWGSVTHWNAFVANLEMHGKGRFFDPRLNNREQFPIAAANGFADLPHIDPDEDRITKKLPALHFYQLSLPAPKPQPDKDFDVEAAQRGDALFRVAAK